jgi:hypothetical protein
VPNVSDALHRDRIFPSLQIRDVFYILLWFSTIASLFPEAESSRQSNLVFGKPVSAHPSTQVRLVVSNNRERILRGETNGG